MGSILISQEDGNENGDGTGDGPGNGYRPDDHRNATVTLTFETALTALGMNIVDNEPETSYTYTDSTGATETITADEFAEPITEPFGQGAQCTLGDNEFCTVAPLTAAFLGLVDIQSLTVVYVESGGLDDLILLLPEEIDLSLDKTVSNPTPNVGDIVTFSIAVENDGPSDATGVDVQDVVPAGYSALGAISDSGVASGNTINWTGLSIADGATETLTFTAVVEATGPYLNIAQVTDADQDDSDSTPNNDDGNQSEDDEDNAAVTPTPVIDLSLVKTVSNETPNVGETVTFSLAVTNDGPSDATGVDVQDVVPAAVSYTHLTLPTTPYV